MIQVRPDIWVANMVAQRGIRTGSNGPPIRYEAALLLHVAGRKSGKPLVDPLVAAPDGDSYIVCASAGGRGTLDELHRALGDELQPG